MARLLVSLGNASGHVTAAALQPPLPASHPERLSPDAEHARELFLAGGILEALHHLAPTPAAYVGLIGSRRKIRLIFENLREAGIDDAALARVTAPVGFDIGSQTVPEIAISIVAELIARRNLGPEGLAQRTPTLADPCITTPA